MCAYIIYIYTHTLYHAHSRGNNAATGCRFLPLLLLLPNFYDRLCNLDGPCNPPFQPFANWPFYGGRRTRTVAFYDSFFLETNRKSLGRDRKLFLEVTPRDYEEEDRYSRHDVAYPIAFGWFCTDTHISSFRNYE